MHFMYDFQMISYGQHTFIQPNTKILLSNWWLSLIKFLIKKKKPQKTGLSLFVFFPLSTEYLFVALLGARVVTASSPLSRRG